MISKFMPAAKEYFKFEKRELLDIVLATLILSFMFSLSDWDGKLAYILHLILIIAIVFISLFAHLSCQKVFAIYYGYTGEFKLSLISLLASLMICFLTEPWGLVLVLVIPGALIYKIIEKHRIGRWPKGPNFSDMGFITSLGIMLNLFIAVIFYGLYLATDLWFFWLVTVINIFFSFGFILPLPLSDGLQMAYGSRYVYIAIAVLVIATLYLMFMKMSFIAVVVLALLTMAILWYTYHYYVERKES